jgi:hypothetical protein
MRNLCTDEVGGVKVKKNEKKKSVLQLERKVFSLLLFFGCSLWLCISKMICRA